MKNILHEWHMNRKIKRILAYNKKHPERCFRFEDHFTAKRSDTLTDGNITVQAIDDVMKQLKAVYGGDSNG